MRKLLQYLDNNILKWAVIATSLFIVLYPKLPSVHIVHTWVYIRLEDFAISGLAILWFIQLLRKKARLALPIGVPIILYWVFGLASLVFSIIFIGPHLANYFPKLAALEYLRRIEYMILFFVGFSVVKTKEDLKEIVKFLFIGIAAIVLYGLGQHFYPYFWRYLPEAFQKTNFCFPSFQTGNEEFAKGIPLCLPVGSRVTSTFGGHYDLAAYLLITLPIVLGTWFVVKKKLVKVALGVLYITGLIILILTASRIAFLAYLFAAVPPLILLKKKKWIIPITLLSFVCLILFSESTIHRFAQTFRLTSVVVNMQGQIVGTTEGGLTLEQQRQLAQGKNAIQANQVIQGVVPEGSSFITLPQQKVATNTAVIKKNLTTKEAQQLQLANGGLAISTLKGNFSVQKALVYDISVTTRLQGEWPHAIQAFFSSPLLGLGQSTLTLAVDNDYLRLLGETGILGFASFLGIFLVFGSFLKQTLSKVEDTMTKIFIYGLIGGVVGLFVNAALFDIFEASKVAEPLWLFMGIGLGAITMQQKKPIAYLKPITRILTTKLFLYSYLAFVSLGAFWGAFGQFFIGDDFVWLKWAATSTFADVPKYFTDASGFFYRPLDKLLMLIFYSFFSFQPQGYHAVIVLLHVFMGIGVYQLAKLILKKKVWGFVAAVLFLLLPTHAENLYWVSALSIDLSSVAILYTTIFFLRSTASQKWRSGVWYVFAMLFAAIALMSYELALVVPVLLLVSDFVLHKKFSVKRLVLFVPFALFDVLYFVMRMRAHAFGVGGDYSYSLVHFIPNVIGNIFGYLALWIFGENSLAFYTLLRTNAKAFSLPIALVVILGVTILVVLLRKQNWKRFITANSVLIFSGAFSLVALLPYLGLGNIAERYGYLASVGFIVSVTWFAESLFEKIHLTRNLKIFTTSCIAIAIFALCLVGLQKAQNDWGKAANITYKSLGYFKIEYGTVPENSRFIVINRPIRYANAWIFPTGLEEGLWFIYGEQTPSVLDASSVSEAKQIASQQPHSYVFIFDKQYKISRIR